MFNFWMNFIFLVVSWLLAVWIDGFTDYNILVSGLFFALYFILPVVKKQCAHFIFIILPFLLFGMFLSPEFNGFIWLIYLALAIQSTKFFNRKKLSIYIVFLYVLTILPYVFYQEWLSVSYVSLLALITGIMLLYWNQATQKEKNLQDQYESIYDEFQLLKRQLMSGEQLVRQEERNQIAREIHDSVGHRLTALLMQMEVARIQATTEETKAKFDELKKLAQISLQDTREAVKALKSEETAGIQAIIQLIRKLEAESQLRLSITMQTGTLSAVLTNQQSVAIYRSIQEALTNMMRHSSSNQAVIEFQIVAQRDLRFQVSHPLKEKITIKEGFGLTNMRERLAEVDGRINIHQIEGKLNVMGQFPLEVKTFD